MKLGWLGLCALLASLAACSSSSAPAAGQPDGATTPPDGVTFTLDTTVAAGGEVLRCKFVTMPADRGEIDVPKMAHHYTEGSHHFLVYRTDLDQMPAGGDVLTDCSETGSDPWMSHVRGVVYAAQAPDGEFDFPAGVAAKFKPGEVLLVQTHYLNTTTSDLAAHLSVSFDFADPATITDEAGVLFFYNPAIYVPGNAAAHASLTCPLPKDVNLVFAASHMHKRGIDYVATTDDVAHTSAGPLYTTKDWSEPVPRVFTGAPPFRLAAGSHISYTCNYQNPDPTSVVSGQSAETNEMCMFIAMYWPRADYNMENCIDGRTDSAGTATAPETLTCLALCPKGDVDCTGGCWQNACPSAPMQLRNIVDCIKGCASSCMSGLSSDPCTTCMNQACPDKYQAFMNTPCN